MNEIIEKAKKHFGQLVKEQLERVERMKQAGDWIDYSKLKPIIIGIVGETELVHSLQNMPIKY